MGFVPQPQPTFSHPNFIANHAFVRPIEIEMKSVIAFDLTMQDRSSYIYRNERGESIIFRIRPFFVLIIGPRVIDVEWAGTRFSVQGTTTWPHMVQSELPGAAVLESNVKEASGSKCYTWNCGNGILKIVGRRPDRFIGKFRTFHLWKDARRCAYWQRHGPNRIKGLFGSSENTVSVAVLVFSFMFDWEDGAYFK